MTATIITATAGHLTAGTAAVSARFLREGEQIKVGAVLTVREVLRADSIEAGLTFVICEDLEGRRVDVRVPSGVMIQLHDAQEEDAEFVRLLAALPVR